MLSPAFFLHYINDLTQVLEEVTMLLFADDCIVYDEIETSEYQVILNNTLQEIADWCRGSQMSLNTDETVFASITMKRISQRSTSLTTT